MKDFKEILYRVLNRVFILSYLVTIGFVVILYSICQELPIIRIVLLLFFCISLYLIRFSKVIPIGHGILCAIASITLLGTFSVIYKEFFVIKQWDFLAFYLFGKIGVEGVDFYKTVDIQNLFSTLKLPFEVSPGFFEEVVQVGFVYPPFTMILIAPLGFFNIETANILWKILILLFLFLDIILLIKIFNADDSNWINMLIILVVTLMFRGTTSTISVSQTNFLLLFFILLIYKNPNDWKSGVYMALAVLIKPIAVIWALYFLINKKWTQLISLSISLILIIIISVILFGIDNYISFFSSPPTDRLPDWQYIEVGNESLFAVISRFISNFGISFENINVNLMVIILTLLLTLLTGFASHNLFKSKQKLSFLIFLPLSLLIYPGSLWHYSIFLIPLLFEILSLRNIYWFLIFLSLLLLINFSLFFTGLSLLILCIIYSFSRISIHKPL